MTPGLAFFYGGMVRSKNVLGMLMQNFFAMGLISRALGGRRLQPRLRRLSGGFIGNFDFAFLKDVGDVDRSPGTPGDFALVIPPIAVLRLPDDVRGHHPGADHRRHRRPAEVQRLRRLHRRVGDRRLPAVAHWVFSPNGWLFKRGALDFAGGAVVHINAGAAALALVLVLGKRKGWPREPMPPHNLPFTMLGTGILWFGWFGFNAGSALAANGLAAQASSTPTSPPRPRCSAGSLVEKSRRPRHHPRRRLGRGRRAGRDHAVRRVRRRHGARSSSGSPPGSCVTSPCRSRPGSASTTAST